MSLYNMLFGVNTATFIILPVLGKHPDWYPRFRDCFIGDPDRPETEGKLIVYTRTGGGNREAYEDAEAWEYAWKEAPGPDVVFNSDIRELPGFLFDYDDDFDSTFANFVFDIPDQWKADVDKITSGNGANVSSEYIEMLCQVMPNISEKIQQMFKPELTSDEKR